MRSDAENLSTMATALKLHYDPKWLEYDLLDPAFLEEQVKQYESGTDDSLEHYRYAAFRKLLETSTALDDLMLDQYIELAQLDEDTVMAEAALALLIRHNGLTEQQLNRLKADQRFKTSSLQTIIEQTQLLRKLDSSSITDEVFDRCIQIGKADVQRKLISKSELSAEQLTVLKDQGANRAIRNLAKDRLRRHR